MDTNTTKTIRDKLTFEREDKIQLVVIKVYHTDNGIFNASDFINDILKRHKNISFSV